MVVRCAGLPLAIIVLGGLLATKETLDEWDIVHRNIKSHLGRGREQGQQSRVHEVLALSYHELPYQLKPCFLYLSHFPEDFDIPAKKLVRLWVAEGFVSPKYELEGDEMLEDFAERCLVELINRCMVQVGITGSSGRIKSCRLHDLMRDLCLSKAKQENFLHIVSPWSRNEKADSSTGRIRRLAIFSEEFLTMNYYKENHHIRSLIYFNENSQLIKSVFKYLKLLRVLDLEGIQLLDGELTEEIGSLIHLRFLSLKKTRIRVLPSSISNLVCLKTLNLETIEELSWEINCTNTNCDMEDETVETSISSKVVSGWTVEAGAMPSLFRLEISDCNKMVTAPHGLKFVSMLQELEIRWMPRAFKHRLEEGGEDLCIVQHVPSIIFLN
uniref:Uncharacterized protein n=1 Tax=Fagus sylvatica TaxID=28930 RepID=A0A2N9HUL8_FAGSY